jgi:hypothetical protein
MRPLSRRTRRCGSRSEPLNEVSRADCSSLYVRLAARRIHEHLGGIEARRSEVREEAKFEKQVSTAQQQLDTVRVVMKVLGGRNGSDNVCGCESEDFEGFKRAVGKV